MGITAFSATYGLCLCPLLFDGIEIRTVRGQEFDCMSALFDGGDDIGSFVEWRPIQDDDRVVGHDGKECQPYPAQEHVGVDGAVPEIYGQECECQDGADGVQPSFRMPIAATAAAYPPTGIPMRPGCIDGETTLVEIHDRTFLDLLMPPDSRLKSQTLDGIRFGVTQSFFYS